MRKPVQAIKDQRQCTIKSCIILSNCGESCNPVKNVNQFQQVQQVSTTSSNSATFFIAATGTICLFNIIFFIVFIE